MFTAFTHPVGRYSRRSRRVFYTAKNFEQIRDMCVSLSRFVQDKTDQASTPCKHKLDEESFTVVSADNIDFQYHFAKVFKVKENAS